VINLESRPVFTPKVGGKWEHNYNAVIDSGERRIDDPDVDEDAAKEWKSLQPRRPA
jgi:hypothetical protein